MGNLMLNGISYSGGGDIDALLPIDTASGAVANFNTSIARGLVSCVAQINAQQASGTPTPVNPLPITGFTGANVADTSDSIEKATYIKGIYEGVNGFVDLGSLTWSKSTATNNTYFYVLFNSGANGTYNAAATNIICSNYQNVARFPLTTVTNTEGIAMEPTAIYIADMNCNNMTPEQFKSYISGKYVIYELATPETPTITPVQFQTLCTSFDINGALISVDWQTEAGTVYGGELDLLSGVLTVTHGEVDLGDLSWTKYTNGQGKDYFRTDNEISDCIKCTSPILTQGLLCESYMEDTWTHTVDSLGYDKTICLGWINKSYIGVCDTNYTSASDFKTAVSGVKLVYPLATPIEYQLTPQQITAFVGENNIWADTGDIEVSFKCTPQDYVDSKISALNANNRSLAKSVSEEPEEEKKEEKKEEEEVKNEK